MITLETENINKMEKKEWKKPQLLFLSLNETSFTEGVGGDGVDGFES